MLAADAAAAADVLVRDVRRGFESVPARESVEFVDLRDGFVSAAPFRFLIDVIQLSPINQIDAPLFDHIRLQRQRSRHAMQFLHHRQPPI